MTDVQVPLLDLKIQYAALRDEIAEAMREVLESQWFIMGPVVKQFEDEIAEYCAVKHAIGCASGSDALLLALMAVGVGQGDEVICPAHTFFATAGSIARLGAIPVWVDIDPQSYNVEADAVREVAEGRTKLKAIIPVDLFGQTVDIDAFTRLGRDLGVPIIEDAAQAIGALDGRGRPAGSQTTIGCFSFFPSKNLGGFGDGGIMTTNDDDLAERLRRLRVHGGHPKYYHQLVGVNSRLDALQAAVLRVKLRHLDGWHEGRRRNADHYDRLLGEIGAVVTPQRPEPPARHIHNQYTIRVPAGLRDELRDHLKDRGVGTEIYYPVPLHLQECFTYLGGREGDLPETEAAARESLALPIYPELTVEQLDHVANTIIAFVRERAAVGSR